MTNKYLYLAAAAAVIGCATTAGQSATPRRGTLLTAEEIANAHADINTAYDAIARLRPNWLAAHGVTSSMSSAGTEYAEVFVDGQRYGDLNSLRNIPAYHVGDIRYYDVTQAGAKFGLRGGGSGVIEVTMKGPSRRSGS
ncbi:MAG: hypothetical protein ACJ79N_03065 [Gemmatimonadaceae bacterium]